MSYDEEVEEEVVEVSHEALIREWKKLHDWVAADPQFLQWNDAVERRWRRYEKNGRRDDDLLMGSELDEAESWIRTRGASVTAMILAGGAAETSTSQAVGRGTIPTNEDISPEVYDFISTSRAKQERLDEERKRIEAKQLADARAVADANRRMATRTGIGLAAALALATLAVGFGLYAQSEKTLADQKTQAAEAAEKEATAREAERATTKLPPLRRFQKGLK